MLELTPKNIHMDCIKAKPGNGQVTVKGTLQVSVLYVSEEEDELLGKVEISIRALISLTLCVREIFDEAAAMKFQRISRWNIAENLCK